MRLAFFSLVVSLFALKSAVLVAQDSKNSADPGQNPKLERKMVKEMTPEQRMTIADAHDKMAKCLRSERPLKECREEMRQSCESTGSACSMMGGVHDGKSRGNLRGEFRGRRAPTTSPTE